MKRFWVTVEIETEDAPMAAMTVGNPLHEEGIEVLSIYVTEVSNS